MATTSQPQTDPPRAEVLPPLKEQKAEGWFGYLFAAVGALVAALYLANIGAGVFELSPDVIPGVGNLDELLFSFVLIYCMRKLGIDLLPYVRGGGKPGTGN